MQLKKQTIRRTPTWNGAEGEKSNHGIRRSPADFNQVNNKAGHPKPPKAAKLHFRRRRPEGTKPLDPLFA